MEDFFKNHTLLVLFLAAVLSVLLAVGTVLSGGTSLGANLFRLVSTPVRAAGSGLASWYNDKQDYYRDTTALEEENAELRRRVAEMEETVRRAASDIEENKRLRQLLGLREQHKDLTDLETAMVTEHSVSNWAASLTLDKGTAHGVAVGNCVMDMEGALVGVVSEAGLNWCTVQTLPDTETSVGAQVFRTGAIGVAHGEFALMERGQLRLDRLTSGEDLLAGDLVVTTGYGGYLPAGLVIGTVDEIRMDDSGSAPYAIVAPKAKFDTLIQVAIVKSFDYVA